MAFFSPRKSRGKNYWSICESRRINGKPKNIPIEYLGTADTLLARLNQENEVTVNSYSHGDTAALLNVANELAVINTINKYIPPLKSGSGPVRNDLSVGTSILLAAIGRACHPTSKMGWYDWCQNTSLEYCLKNSFVDLDSQHFWDQMQRLPAEHIPLIEEELVKNIFDKSDLKLDLLLYDTTNFFTFIDSQNLACKIPKRGKNKQKRSDLRQFGMALLVTKDEQIPLFHKTYQGNKNDITSFKENFSGLLSRLRNVTKQLADVTMVFDKGNNSRDNFKKIDNETQLYYVAGLVPSYFKDLIEEANKNYSTIKIDDLELPAYRIKKEVWGKERTCLVTISQQLKEGQIQGIYQHLEKKYKDLEEFKRQLENPKNHKQYSKEEIENRLQKIIKGQFIEEILKYNLLEIPEGKLSFTYHIDYDCFNKLKEEVLGRKILITNRHEWSNEEIILAYKGQAKVEYVFKNFKNPYHLAIRPQFHWTDQKIEVHVLICVISYLLTRVAYSRARKKAGYKRNINNFLSDLRKIRLACILRKKGLKVNYQLENIPDTLANVVKVLNISNDTIRPHGLLL
ncbi:MAG: IS1634 family transposase [Oligoflexales bacterium]|nr:IS1634 family transposase [Oligoflexales bacterium]